MKLASAQKVLKLTPIEGLLWRCVEDNLSFKVINNKYLLKEK